MKKWNQEDINYLKENYSHISNKEISMKLNRTVLSISKKAFDLNLKKSLDYKKDFISKRNKIYGRDLNLNNLKRIARKYKTKGEFQRLDPSAYTTARINGYLNNITKHMLKSQFSIPENILGYILENIIKSKIIKNNRKIIKPYELDIYLPKYNLAFEYDGKRWHKNNKNDKIKNELCVKENIKLIRIKENNKDYIYDIKNQLISNLDSINKICHLNIKPSDILIIKNENINNYINDKFIDNEYIKRIVLKYDKLIDFRKKENYLYNFLIKRKLNHYLDNLSKEKKKWSLLDIDNEINKYEYLNDFIKKSNSCYNFIKKNKLDHKLKKLKRINNRWSIIEIKKVIKENDIKSLYKLKKLYPGSINYIKKNNKTEYIKELINS